jgi:nucleoside-diphosphate-sugar epimerase
VNILITGSNGFVGKRLSAILDARSSVSVFRGVRNLHSQLDVSSGRLVCLPDLLDESPVFPEFSYDVVIHTAGLASPPTGFTQNSSEVLHMANVRGTIALAEHAAAQGVKRFIFISSIKVNGEETQLGNPFSAGDTPAPVDPYGLSKAEAENELRNLAARTGMEMVIIRPPLVYGPGVKGNFLLMLKLVDSGFPLPFGAIKNKRSMIAVDNLADLIASCVSHPLAANQIFLASDDCDLSTPELLNEIAIAKEKAVHLLPFPQSILTIAASVIGKRAIGRRVVGSLQVNISETKERLEWSPPISLSEGIRRCVQEF